MCVCVGGDENSDEQDNEDIINFISFIPEQTLLKWHVVKQSGFQLHLLPKSTSYLKDQERGGMMLDNREKCRKLYSIPGMKPMMRILV